MPDKPKIAVIGGGPGGYTAAIRAAQRGAEVALFEKDRVGGVCLNRGCIPTKALIESAKAYECAVKLAGVEAVPPVAQVYAAASARKTSVVDRLVKGVEFLLKKHKVAVHRGAAVLEKPGLVSFMGESGRSEFRADGVIIATGSENVSLPGMQPDGERVLDSDGVLGLSAPPASMVVIGGGAIGCEWASLFAAFGSRIDVVELMPQLVPGAEPEIAQEIARSFKKRKIGVHTGVKVESLSIGDTGVTVVLAGGKTLHAEKVLVSVGRRPATFGALGRDCGVKTQGSRVEVDDRCAAGAPGVFAIGDVTGRFMLAHFAAHQGTVAAENLTGGDRKFEIGAVPACIFTEPEAAWVGMTTGKAVEAGFETFAGSFPFRALGRAHAADKMDGQVKIVAEKGTGRVLGVHAVGPRATDLVAEGTLAVRFELTVHDLEETIHAHPTFAESMAEAAGDALGIAINK